MDEQTIQFYDERVQRLFELLVQTSDWSVPELAAEIGVSVGWTHTLLHRLVESGRVWPPKGRKRYWKLRTCDLDVEIGIGLV